MKRHALFILYILILSGTACSSGIHKSAPVYINAEVIYRGSQCNGPEKGPSAEWVLDAEHLSLVYSRLHRNIIGSSVSGPPEVDLSSFILLMVDMGHLPTSGYGIELADRTVQVAGGTADIRVVWVEPAPGSMQAQVISSPCIMIKLPRTGYDSVSLTDQNGRVLLKLGLPVR